jgi:amino acid adenylation domain-containing protein/non-ribosomal peptide synthase protein (TIGR01720 family)
MLFHALSGNDVLGAASAAYFEQVSYRLQGKLDVPTVEKSLSELFKRHDILRTVFVHEGLEHPMQVVLSGGEVDIYYEDISKSGRKEDMERYIKEFKEKDKRRYFDLSKDVLMRVAILRAGSGEYELIWSFHHILMDGWCMGIINAEFFEIYSSFLENRDFYLPPVKPYKTYIRWLENQDKEVSKEYWTNYLDSYDEAAFIPRLRKFNKNETGYKGENESFTLTKEKENKLRKLAGKNQVTLNIIFRTLWGIILGKYNGKRDVVFGAVVSGRPPDIEGVGAMVGLFINTIPVRVCFEEKDKFNDLIKKVQAEAAAGASHHYYPLAKIQSDSPLKQNLINHIFIFENFPAVEQIKSRGEKSKDKGETGRITLSNVEVFEQTNYDFNVIVAPGKQLLVRIDYNGNVYEKGLLEKVAVHFERVLAQVAEDETLRISDIILFSDEEKRQVLFDFNDTAARCPEDKTLHRLFEEQAERSPDHTAVDLAAVGTSSARCAPVGVRTTLTYGELEKEANLLASVLIEKGVQPGTIVGLIIERSLEMVAGILGILKAGGAYLPIGPEYPGQRKKYILKDSAARILLTTRDLKKDDEDWSNLGVETLFISPVTETDRAKVDAVGSLTAALTSTCRAKPADLAYVIYTSGTTGRPKGVLVEHKGVVNYTWWRINNYDFHCGNITLESFSFTFDGFCCSFYSSLLSGGTLVLIPDSRETDLFYIKDVIKAAGVTNTIMVPAMYGALLECAEGDDLNSLKWVTLGGEEANINLLNKSREKYPHLPIYNEYGPTENSIGATFHRHYMENGNTGIIGKPNANTRLYILDNSDNPVPIGIPGELVIAGAGVARGYLNRPELTAEKFINITSGGQLFEKNRTKTCADKNKKNHHSIPLYKTGDLVRRLLDGNIEFLGRVDYQVKIRGFRIELGEIESLLQKHEQIKEAIVMARETEEGDKFLSAYIVSTLELSASGLREYLLKELPGYMIPSYFVPMEKLPLTPIGKIDRSALPFPAGINRTGEVEYQPPGNEIEAMLTEAWEKILGREKIGINENFFMIGGDSIKSIRINSRLFISGYKLEMKDIFGFPTIAELAARVQKLKQAADQSVVTGIVPLTPIQNEFFQKHRATASYFNQSVMFFSKEGFAEEAVTAVFSKIQEHHDALRMTYEEVNGEVVQKNHGLDYPLSLSVYDLSSHENAAAELTALANKIQAGINLEEGPLMKLGLFHLDDGDRLLIAIHHLIIDGVSWRILFEDIGSLYRRYKNGEPLTMPRKTDSFKLWAENLKEYANSELFLREKKYWAEFSSLEIPAIERDFAIEDNLIMDTEAKSFSLSREDTDRLLTKVNEAFNTEVNDILLTALGLSIRETYGHNRVLVALEGHGREEILKGIDINRTVGWFTSVYPILLNLSMADDLSRQIKEIKESLHKIPNKGVGYGMLKYLTAGGNKPELSFDISPQVSFNYLGQFDSDIKESSFEMAKESAGSSVDAKTVLDYDFMVNGILSGRKLTMSIRYSRKQYKPAAVELLKDNFKKKLEQIISYCASRETKEITPSDLTYDELSLDAVESISAMFDK